ncbi:S-adenosyl-L-methionine-dependent methyltransferase [Suillus placidus]|uniref:S-adenosyl-L-methionine-dependent methyltransferase n=1 Tax=Suillus placidus TaxID=48579 RepID=A0A9P6ZRZ2_9AGAM|nr:S-adenosyl-L-methionine-dependent methyltransferase [Suillus placidus]
MVESRAFPKMTEPNEVKVEALLDIINSSAREAMAQYKNTGHGVPGADSSTFHLLDLATDTLALRKAIRLLEVPIIDGHYMPCCSSSYFFNNYDWACTNVAMQSRIADILDKHPEGLSVDVLADAVNLDKIKTARILRVPAPRGCFKEVKRDVFANTRVCLMLKSTNNVWCCLQHLKEYPKYAAVLYETMIDQEKEGRNNSNDFWDMDIFQRAMMGYTDIQGSFTVLHYYPWDNVSSVVDVGSGIGAMSIPLAKMFPHLRITNQDLPETIVHSKKAWEENAPEALLDGRVEFVPINFLEGSPVVGKDVYYDHYSPDDESRAILHNVRKAMEPNSRVLIHECVLLRTFEEPDVGANESSKAPEHTLLNFGSHTTYHTDMSMWLVANGKERTLNEFKILGASAGLVLTQIYDLVGTMVMEFRIAQD